MRDISAYFIPKYMIGEYKNLSPGPTLTKLRRSLFPIESSELYKFLPMSVLTFLLLLNRNILRSLKESLLVTEIGSEAVSFAEIFIHVPLAMIALFAYNKLSNKLRPETVFRVVILAFLVFFGAFAFFIIPHRDLLYLGSATVDNFIDLLPNFRWVILLCGKWGIALFYVISELWAVIACSLMFWQYANKITNLSEAPRFYVLFSLFGQVNLLVSGKIVKYFSRSDHIFMQIFKDTDQVSSTDVTVKSLIVLCIIFGLLCIVVHRYIEVRVGVEENSRHFVKKDRDKRMHLNFIDSIKIVFRSHYLRMICVIVFAYSATMTWADCMSMCMMKKLFPTTADFCDYKGDLLFYTGLFTILFSVCGIFLLKIFGWIFGAISIPIVIFITGGIFFASIILFKNIEGSIPLSTVVLLGGINNVMSRAIKYSLFDATREMTYIPLDDEMRTKGKAAVDIVGDNIGKILGSGLQFTMLTIISNSRHEDLVEVLLIIFVLVCIFWIYAVFSLGKDYKKILNKT